MSFFFHHFQTLFVHRAIFKLYMNIIEIGKRINSGNNLRLKMYRNAIRPLITEYCDFTLYNLNVLDSLSIYTYKSLPHRTGLASSFDIKWKKKRGNYGCWLSLLGFDHGPWYKKSGINILRFESDIEPKMSLCYMFND